MGKHRWPITGDTWAPDAAAEVMKSTRASRADDPSSNLLARRRRRTLATLPHEVLPHPPAGEDQPEQPAIRWGVARSAALVFLGVALAVGAALFLVRSSEPSAAAVSVHLENEQGAADGVTPTEPSTAPEVPVGAAVEPDDLPSPTTSARAAEEDTASAATGDIVVYVTGSVSSPGVVTVPVGTRLFDIVERVGGALPEADLEGINLAGTAHDGQHLHVLAVGEVPRPGGDSAEPPEVGEDPAGQSGLAPVAAAAPGSSAGSASGGVIDINTATLAEIDTLPRVGPVLSQRIIEWRELNGPFARAADVDAVPGIGPALLEGILPLISVQ